MFQCIFRCCSHTSVCLMPSMRWLVFDSCWSRCKFWSVTFIDAIWGPLKSPRVLCNNSRSKTDRDVDVISLYLSCHGASTDMQHDLPDSLGDLEPRSNVDLNFQGRHAYFYTRFARRNAVAPELCHKFLVKTFKRFYFCKAVILTFSYLHSLILWG